MFDRTAARVRGTPLRARLVALLLMLVASALLLAGAATVAALRGYLMNEVDTGVADLARAMANDTRPRSDDDPVPGRPGPVGPSLLYVWRTDATGTSMAGSSPSITDPPAPPQLGVAGAIELGGEPYTVPSQSGDTQWRAITLPVPDESGTVTVAEDIGGISATVNRLIRIQLSIGAVVLVALGVAGWFLVRRSLRPLAAVERTASAIAAGDRDRRAPALDPRTEVGSLGASFNTMVDDLAGALAAQQASERAARDSAERAQASEARMRQFIADAGHELRTPLTSVRGFAELYRIGAVSPGAGLDDAMSRIEAESARMGVLVEDLLLLARLDRQRPLQLQSVDLVDLVADAVAAARAGAPDRAFRVTVTDRAEGLAVPGDCLRLRQVIDNLLSNAIHYSPADEPVQITIDVSPDVDRPQGWAIIEVSDRGPGMPPEVAGRVFERFYRADAARSRAEGGSGLGLAIVAAIVAAHAGRIDLRTTVGAGSAFRVLLPPA